MGQGIGIRAEVPCRVQDLGSKGAAAVRARLEEAEGDLRSARREELDGPAVR
ncbi:hypothetical protein ACF06L_22870 [Streptomyces sp. NPDC015408]|uniref:hypothetical protein n=1 Tax=Streptomyces sp. NPDC015408 TaxID=3364956 RepID=UPI0036F6E604